MKLLISKRLMLFSLDLNGFINNRIKSITYKYTHKNFLLKLGNFLLSTIYLFQTNFN